MANILHDVEPQEISLVDRAANKRSFLIMKSENGISEENQKDQSQETSQEQTSLNENIENNSADKQDISSAENQIVDQNDANGDNNSGKEAEEGQSESEQQVNSDVEKSAVNNSKILKSESGDVAVDLNLLPENMRGQIETLFKSREDEIKKAAHFENLFKKQIEERETREFIEKASIFKNLPIKTEELGLILKSAFHAIPKEQYEKLEQVLKSANEKMEGFFKEIGQNSGNNEVSDPYSELQRIGDEIAKAEKLTSAQGFKKAIDKHPDLYKAYKDTRNKK